MKTILFSLLTLGVSISFAATRNVSLTGSEAALAAELFDRMDVPTTAVNQCQQAEVTLQSLKTSTGLTKWAILFSENKSEVVAPLFPNEAKWASALFLRANVPQSDRGGIFVSEATLAVLSCGKDKVEWTLSINE